MTIEEQLKSSIEVVAGLTGERDDLRATIEKLTVGTASELESVKADVVSKDAKISELTVALDGISAELALFKAKASELEQSHVSASKQAAVIASSVGITPTALPMEGEASKEAVNHLAVFLSMPLGKDRSDYFNAHKATIIKAAI
jgi:chromosome segregation ATPase